MVSAGGLDAAFWRGRRVLITGHTGFKGSWLSLWLARMGAAITGYALPPPTTPSLFELAGVDRVLHHIVGDIRDPVHLHSVAAEAGPEIILHLAAQSLVRVSLEAPVDTFMTNVMGTAHVLETARQLPGLRAVVVVTSDKCYAHHEASDARREGDPLGGNDPYSSSKACAELVTAAYRASYFAGSPVSVASVRAGNVIGGGDWSRDRLVPDVMAALRAGLPVRLRHPESIRPWQHVLDPLHGYLMLAERLFMEGAKYAEAWNFGPNGSEERDVRSVAEWLIGRWGSGSIEVTPDPHSVETGVLRIDSSRAQERLGWLPRAPIETALEWTASWYRDHQAGVPAQDLVARDLDRFVA
jgi:CDP-glucose 4,6-dehydratase